MKVIQTISQDKTNLSFEFFPPKTEEQEKQLFAALEKLTKFHPNFVSVTYGAMGTVGGKTFEIVDEIKNKFSIEPVAHLTCVAANKEQIKGQLADLKNHNIQNILALRGDPPLGEEKLAYPKDGFRYASDLVGFIKKQDADFCVGVAGYPEGHIESPSLEKDIEYLKLKVDAGAEYIITQLFFDNQCYYDFVTRCRAAGINVPIIPGLMVITSLKQIKKFTETCGAAIPEELHAELEACGEDAEEVIKVGTEWTVGQCKDLLESKVPGLHFFVLNKAEPVSTILNSVKKK
ncbi:MAG: methylenetetrahydrofolate reductase [NAD(P)H] [Candidatus Saganbacteria bacterium]|nr:methylenetetrahydrofolate reductase [NAD(P)H] [Candidatus Saganbacteria bacterium]